MRMNQGGVNEPDEVSPETLQVADGTLATHGDNPVAALLRSVKVGQADDVADGPTSAKIISVPQDSTPMLPCERLGHICSRIMLMTSKPSCSIDIGGCPPLDPRRSRCRPNRSEVPRRCHRRCRLAFAESILGHFLESMTGSAVAGS